MGKVILMKASWYPVDETGIRGIKFYLDQGKKTNYGATVCQLDLQYDHELRS